MGYIVDNRVSQYSTTSGTASFQMSGGTVEDGFRSFANAPLLFDGDTFPYIAIDYATGEWEVGKGTWASATQYITRTTVVDNHLGTTATVNFTNPPNVTIALSAGEYTNPEVNVTFDGSLTMNGTVNILGTLLASISHSDLSDLSADDHTQYLLVNGTRAMAGDLLPSTTNSWDLGSSTYRWSSLHSTYVEAYSYIKAQGNSVYFELAETDAAVDHRRWALRVNDTVLAIQALTDAGAGGGNRVEFTRTNQSLDAMNLYYGATAWFNADNTTKTLTVENLVADTTFEALGGASISDYMILESDGSNPLFYIDAPTGYGGQLIFRENDIGEGYLYWASATNAMVLSTAGGSRTGWFEGGAIVFYDEAVAEYARFDPSSNALLIGTTDSTLYNNTTGEGIRLGPDLIHIARDNAPPMALNRMTANGQLIEFYTQGVYRGGLLVDPSDRPNIINSIGYSVVYPYVFQAKHAGTSITTGGTVTLLTFDTSDITDAGYTYTSGELTIGSALDGRRLEFFVQLELELANRSMLRIYLEKDSGSGYSVIAQSANYNTRYAVQNIGTTTIAGKIDTAATGDKYRVRYSCSVDAGTPVFTGTVGNRFLVRTIN